jgi:type IV pilus assembly protein PilM
VDRDDLIRHSIRRFLERNQVKGEAIFVGVPGSSTFARFVKLPPVDPKKIPEIVRFEAIQQIPFPLDQVNWDYQTFLSPESPDVEVGIFAMKKELVGQVLANFRASGVTVHGVQMSPLAVYNAAAFDGMTDGKGTVLIDMGAEHTDLVIMDQGRLWLRTINIGGNHFTDALAKSFKQPFSRAESLKKTAATSKYQKQIFQAMRPIFADLVAEIQRSIGHYNQTHRDSKLERIVGMGNPFKLPNLQKYLQQELKMEVIRLDSFRKVNADGKLAAGLNETILSMASAYGLAIQGLGLASIDTNLLPLEIARQMMWRSKRPWFIGVAALMVGVLGYGVFAYMSSDKAFAGTQGTPKDKNQAAISDAQNMQRKWQGLGNTFAKDKDAVDAFLKLAEDRAIWPSLNLDLLGALPQNKRRGQDAAAVQRAIVITAINSDYSSHLQGTQGTAPSAPTGGMGGMGGMDEFGVGPGGFQGGMGGPGGMAVAPAAPAGVQAAGGPAPGQPDRGFNIVITGYVEPPSQPSEGPGYNVVNTYQTQLLERAPSPAEKPTEKPYYFVKVGYTGEVIPAPPPGVQNAPTGTVIWGAGKGPFWDVFASEVSGVKPEERMGQNGAIETIPVTNIGPVDLYAPATPTGPKMLYGAFNFTLKIKVYMKDPGKLAPAK